MRLNDFALSVQFAAILYDNVWLNCRAFARDPKGRGWVRISAGPLPGNSLGQAAHTHVPLPQSSVIWYRPMGGDALRLER